MAAQRLCKLKPIRDLLPAYAKHRDLNLNQKKGENEVIRMQSTRRGFFTLTSCGPLEFLSN